MRLELSEVQWLHASQELSLQEFMQISGLPETELRNLVEFGVLTPLDPQSPPWSFSADGLTLARTANRLRRDFDLDGAGLAVALTLVERVWELEAHLRDLRAQLPQNYVSG